MVLGGFDIGLFYFSSRSYMSPISSFPATIGNMKKRTNGTFGADAEDTSRNRVAGIAYSSGHRQSIPVGGWQNSIVMRHTLYNPKPQAVASTRLLFARYFSIPLQLFSRWLRYGSNIFLLVSRRKALLFTPPYGFCVTFPVIPDIAI